MAGLVEQMKAQELYQELKNKIRRGELSGKLPSIAELCAYYHISHNTVKKALDILKMQQLAYGVPGKGVYVRNFVRQKKNPDKVLIYCSLFSLKNAFYLRMLNMLRQKAASESFSIDLLTDLQNIDLSSYRLALVVRGWHEEENRIMFSRFAPVKVYGINLEYMLPPGHTVSGCRNDNFSGGYMAIEHLYCHGHRNIGIFAIDLAPAENIFHHRLGGVEKFVCEHPEIKLHIWDVPYCSPNCGDFISRQLSEHPEITGIFAFTDDIAMRVINCLREHKRSVPDDVSVIGYDNAVFSDLLVPALTTIEEDAEAMAEAVCQIVLDHFSGKELTGDIIIKPELVERASVKSI